MTSGPYAPPKKRPRLVARLRTIHNRGQSYQARRWMRVDSPENAPDIGHSEQPLLFADVPHPTQIPDRFEPSPQEMYSLLGTRAPAFKAWFGDWEVSEQQQGGVSAVRDQSGNPQLQLPFQTQPDASKAVGVDGKPIVLFHGSGASFRVFDTDRQGEGCRFGPGFYFSENPHIADGGTTDAPDTAGYRVRRVLLHGLDKDAFCDTLQDALKHGWEYGGFHPEALHPDDMDDAAQYVELWRMMPYITVGDAIKAFEEGPLRFPVLKLAQVMGLLHRGATYTTYLNIRKPLDLDDIAARQIFAQRIGITVENAQSLQSLIKAFDSPEAFNEAVRLQGYDGIAAEVAHGDSADAPRHRVWVAFEPNQIKAEQNAGTFSAQSEDIFKSADFERKHPRGFHGYFSQADDAGSGSLTEAHKRRREFLQRALDDAPHEFQNLLNEGTISNSNGYSWTPQETDFWKLICTNESGQGAKGLDEDLDESFYIQARHFVETKRLKLQRALDLGFQSERVYELRHLPDLIRNPDFVLKQSGYESRRNERILFVKNLGTENYPVYVSVTKGRHSKDLETKSFHTKKRIDPSWRTRYAVIWSKAGLDWNTYIQASQQQRDKKISKSMKNLDILQSPTLRTVGQRRRSGSLGELQPPLLRILEPEDSLKGNGLRPDPNPIISPTNALGVNSASGTELSASIPQRRGVIAKIIRLPKRVLVPLLARSHLAKRASPKLYDYASTQVNIPQPLASTLIGWTQENFREHHLAKDGIETEPHITVKYGLLCGAREGLSQSQLEIEARSVVNILRATVADCLTHELGDFQEGVCAVLGPLQLFRTNPEFDVLYVSVVSPSLTTLNSRIASATPCVDTHPEYKPHITLAYLQKGAGDVWDLCDVFAGVEVRFDALWYSGRDGWTTPILLNVH